MTLENEHYVFLDAELIDENDVIPFLKSQLEDIFFRLDSKVFFLRLGTVYEAYAKSAEITNEALNIQLACQNDLNLCDPLTHIWNRRGDLTGVTIRGVYNLYQASVTTLIIALMIV